MPTKAPVVRKPVTAWSFSRYGDYKRCPAYFAYKHLDKLPEPGNEAMHRGSAIGSMAENYALGKLTTMPAELSLFKAEFKGLKAQKMKFVEEQWAWTHNWEAETEWNNWANCWVRVKIDAGYFNQKANALVIIDHKTGKMRPENQVEYMEQLDLYALAGLVKYPEAAIVSPRLWYLDAGIIYPNGEDADQPELEYTQADTARLKKVWMARTKPMFNDKQYKPTPNSKCVWCPYSTAKGGPCKY